MKRLRGRLFPTRASTPKQEVTAALRVVAESSSIIRAHKDELQRCIMILAHSNDLNAINRPELKDEDSKPMIGREWLELSLPYHHPTRRDTANAKRIRRSFVRVGRDMKVDKALMLKVVPNALDWNTSAFDIRARASETDFGTICFESNFVSLLSFLPSFLPSFLLSFFPSFFPSFLLSSFRLLSLNMYLILVGFVYSLSSINTTTHNYI